MFTNTNFLTQLKEIKKFDEIKSLLNIREIKYTQNAVEKVLSFKYEDIFYIAFSKSLMISDQYFNYIKKLNSKDGIYLKGGGIIYYWRDEEELEVNFLDPNILYKLFLFMKKIKDIVFFDLSLDDIYFSKQSQEFKLKNYCYNEMIEDIDININFYEYRLKNILFNKSPHIYYEKELDKKKCEELLKPKGIDPIRGFHPNLISNN